MAESFVSFDEKYHINIIRKRQEGYRENIQRILRRKAKAMGEKILEYARWRSSRTGVTLKDMRRMGHPYRLSPGIISQGGGALRQRPSQVYIQNQMSMSGRPKKNPSFPIFSEGWKLRVYSSRKMKGDITERVIISNESPHAKYLMSKDARRIMIRRPVLEGAKADYERKFGSVENMFRGTRGARKVRTVDNT